MQYMEEVELLHEEMRRVLAFLEWDGNRWKECALRAPQRVNDASHPSNSPENKGLLEQGLRAYYALRQASIRQRLFAAFAKQWHDVLAFIEMADQELAGGEEEVDIVDSMV